MIDDRISDDDESNGGTPGGAGSSAEAGRIAGAMEVRSPERSAFLDEAARAALEAERIAALRRYAILDTAPEPAYDRLVSLAAKRFGVDLAMVSLIDTNRQWFKAVCGLEGVRETERSIAFCATAIKQDAPLVLTDARADPRFADNPFVTGGIKIRFYAGAPLITPDGYRLGTLCVLDTRPRPDVTAEDVEFLQDLAAVVVDQLEMRRVSGHVLREIETRVETKGSLDMVQSQIRQFLEFAPVPVAMLDNDLRYLMASRSWQDLYDLGPDPLIGRHHYELFPGLSEEWKSQHLRCLGGETITAERDRAYRRDGSFAWVRRCLQPWRKPNGEIGGIIMFNEDISDRVRIEDQLVQSQKMEAIGQLTGGLAHDFNNLMSVVMGNLQLVERALGDRPKALRRTRSALQAIERGAELTRRLLAFARRQKLETGLVDVNAVVDSMVDILRHTLGENITLTCRLAPDLPAIETDPTQLETAILNLAVNARDAMPNGGALTIETGLASGTDRDRPKEIASPELVAIAVSDTGTGIEPDKLAHVFDPFFTTKAIGEGSGLGLSIVFGFMRQSGGEVEIESTIGAGTRVELLFPPAARAAPRARPAALPDDMAAPLCGHVLLVEDQEDVRDMAQALLEDLGLAVTAADLPRTALAILETDQPIDLLFTDIVMPGEIDGLWLAEAARTIRPGLPVLFASGYADTALTTRGRDGIPPENLINKPYRREDLQDKLKIVLDRRDRGNAYNNTPS